MRAMILNGIVDLSKNKTPLVLAELPIPVPKENEILIDSFHVFQCWEMLSMEEIAKKHNLSRERIRQIRNKLFHNTLRVPIASL